MTGHDLGRVLLLVCALAVMPACDDSPTSPSDAVGQTWHLVSLQRDGSDLILSPDPTQFTLRLEENGRVAVKADCNACGGSYSLSGSTIDFSAIACTKVGCPNSGPFDSDFAAALEGPKAVSVDDPEMVIQGGGVTLRFRR
jgi:heat shock protein HslJ